MRLHDGTGDRLPSAASVLAVCAHPDDESFGLGAGLSSLREEGSSLSVLCFTHGEASSLGSTAGSLHERREKELVLAAEELGVARVHLLEHPDGYLGDEPMEQLRAEVRLALEAAGADLLLVFDEGGITGHSDHVRATEVAVGVAGDAGVRVLAWTLPEAVAAQLNEEFDTTFVGRRRDDIDMMVEVDRGPQQRAIRCHASQSRENPVLLRRLELQGSQEAFRWLRR